MLTIMIKGGPLMWAILFCFIVGLGVFFERWFHYHRAHINAADFVNGIRNSLKLGNISEAIANCEESPGPVAAVVRAALVNHDRSREEISEAVQDAAHSEVARLERNLVILATIAQVTPLIGFFGTVLGMIHMFRDIEHAPLLNPSDLAGGIWEALLTTAGGLAVAIPAYVAYNYLVSRVQNLVLDMEKAANGIIMYLARRDEVAGMDEPVILPAKQNK